MAELGESTRPARPRPQPALLVRGHDVPLHEGETLIGRGEDCHLCILSGLVSRRHAILLNSAGRVTIEDLGSRNGIFVNGLRLEGRGLLQDGDSILLGTTELSFFYAPPDDAPSSGRIVMDDQGNLVDAAGEQDEASRTTLVRFEPEPDLELEREDITIQGSQPPPPRSASPSARKAAAPVLRQARKSPVGESHGPVISESGKLPRLSPIARIVTSSPPLRPSTQPPPAPDALGTVLSVVERMLGRGDTDAAARTLGTQIDRRLAAASRGQKIERDMAEAAALSALRLVELTGDPAWLDRAVELHTVSRRAMSVRIIDRLEPLLVKLPQGPRDSLTRYQGLIRELLSVVEVDELEACERILALG